MPRPTLLSARLLLSCLLLALLAACAVEPIAGDTGAGGGAGGKADDLSDGPALDYRSYEVLFTNPVCAEYAYDEPVPTADGEGLLTAKPKDVYCKREDAEASGARPESPQYRLLEWFEALAPGDAVFLASLSYSNQPLATALCDAATRGVDVTLVLDRQTSRGEELEACGGTVLIRGHTGGIGYAHNKLVMVNPDGDSEYMKLAFGSGNLSSGAVLHHENWHFLEVRRDSFFVEAHRCLMNAQLDESASMNGKTPYREFMEACRDAIPYPEERDIRAFFIPNYLDSRELRDLTLDGVASAAAIDVGAHRFGYTDLVEAMADRLASDASVSVRMVADDDLYWLAPYGGGPGDEVGNNSWFEADNVAELEAAGDERFEIRYLETNHPSHLLHHNKFLVFHDRPERPDAVLCGAANLTRTGFWDNFENIYWIEVPAVVEAFDAQYARFWEEMATAPAKMPVENVTP